MTQDEIIDLAIQAGIKRRTDVFYSEYCDGIYGGDLETFAKLVAAKEREACAKVCEDDDSNAGEWHWEARVGKYFAKAIRARGEQA